MDVDHPPSSKATSVAESDPEDDMPVDTDENTNSLDSRVNKLDERVDDLAAYTQGFECEMHDTVEERIKEALEERFPIKTEADGDKVVKGKFTGLGEDVQSMSSDIVQVSEEMAELFRARDALETENDTLRAENIEAKKALVAVSAA